ncbi:MULTISPECIES: hypothetical protein [Moorena]|uniref:hypothetical protein n=1 Tax=Moorena TaxID=1155738 RepID=UPI00030290DE|nr:MULTISPECIES: hypothetical protein [Moorena]NEQ17959.1 hypothetical protein [Moorena sp. SIO3E2]NEP32248.1 hypothetical protein [Moorena sp. SIO3B2]NEP66197.1 hypothetical protein [Moorena sp. SIO3A5]NEQ09339.1 hypothetical protein [Moorena sp. SIO4E2]NER89296.1 hypothetical protein [Moorena sp. SIO3A2]
MRSSLPLSDRLCQFALNPLDQFHITLNYYESGFLSDRIAFRTLFLGLSGEIEAKISQKGNILYIGQVISHRYLAHWYQPFG